MFNRIAKSICNSRSVIKRQPKYIPQSSSSFQWRSFTSTLTVAQEQQKTSPSQETSLASTSSEYTFKHPRSKEIFDKMIQLQLEEIRLLTELINEKLGIKITEADKRGFSGAIANGGDADGAEDAQETVKKTAFDLKLTAFDEKSKIKIIKEVRAITGLGLKEAKDMVEGVPKTLKKQIKMEEAEELKAKLEAVGAKVEID